MENQKIHTNNKIQFCNLGLIEYNEALHLQYEIVEGIINGSIDHHTLLLLEHPPVFTLGKNRGKEDLILPQSLIKEKDIQIIQIERGGSVTYHSPGQLIAYPMIHLHQKALTVTDFVDMLEEVMIRTADDFGIHAERNEQNRGVWVKHRKLGSIGIAIRRGVSFHGLAMNINNSLVPFSWINPCGLENVTMTSLQNEIGKELNMAQIKKSMQKHFSNIFDCTLEEINRTVLIDMITAN